MAEYIEYRECTEHHVESGETDPPDLLGMTTYEKVGAVCEYFLCMEECSNSEKTLSGEKLHDKAVSHQFSSELGAISKNTFLQYLSNTVRDTDSRINCLGRKQGYYLLDAADIKIEKALEIDIDSSDKSRLETDKEISALTHQYKQKERLLYPVLESWLIAQGYQGADISTGKSLGKWGNPDVAGISALDTFNGLSIEVVTVESKTSLDGWEKWIFEAISHRRFANRSYFAFAHPAETISKIPQDMRYYAELYDIGVLVLSIEKTKFDDLMNGQLDNPLESEDVDIVEMYSAPYNFVQPKYQKKFCDALGITCIKELYQWGAVQG